LPIPLFAHVFPVLLGYTWLKIKPGAGGAAVKFAINVPNFGDCASARLLAEWASDAEEAGWDGFFIWDHVAFDWPDAVVDPWIALTAMTMSTERIRLGAMVTPLPRRRPWKVARETASLDQLSGGRLHFGVGIGGSEAEFAWLGEPADMKVRAAMLDEGLDVLTGLWRGEPFNHQGIHYSVQRALFWPTPVQQPRIPIWVAGMWPNKAPLRRAARWDGVIPIPIYVDGDLTVALTPDEIREIKEYVLQHREEDAPFDIVVTGITPGGDSEEAARIIAAYADVGATWWQENLIPLRFDWEWGPPPWPLEAMHERIVQGPPRSE
jgi:probable F420-dependent oxidoreductase